MNESTIIRTVARVGPWLAPLPSAWFIGRSIYQHLLVSWDIAIHPAIHIAVAVISGLVIELLAIVSVHNSLALFRWNDYGQVRKEAGWEKAPFRLSLACTAGYVVAAVILLVVLEAVPSAAAFAPVMFPALGLVGAVNLGILDQHQSRLSRYGMTWDLTRERKSVAPMREDATQETHDATYTCASCNATFASRYRYASHMRWGCKEASDADQTKTM